MIKWAREAKISEDEKWKAKELWEKQLLDQGLPLDYDQKFVEQLWKYKKDNDISSEEEEEEKEVLPQDEEELKT